MLFMLSMNFTEQGIRGIKDAPKRAQQARDLAKKFGGEIKQIYLTTGDSDLVAMLEAARESSGLIGDIATASRDQAAAIEEVTSAVRALDEMTQHNAALVEETNAAIEQTEAQAVELDRVVAVFTLASGKGGAVPTKSPAGTNALPKKDKSAARSPAIAGNTALAQEWSEF